MAFIKVGKRDSSLDTMVQKSLTFKGFEEFLQSNALLGFAQKYLTTYSHEGIQNAY